MLAVNHLGVLFCQFSRVLMLLMVREGWSFLGYMDSSRSLSFNKADLIVSSPSHYISRPNLILLYLLNSLFSTAVSMSIALILFSRASKDHKLFIACVVEILPPAMPPFDSSHTPAITISLYNKYRIYIPRHNITSHPSTNHPIFCNSWFPLNPTESRR